MIEVIEVPAACSRLSLRLVETVNVQVNGDVFTPQAVDISPPLRIRPGQLISLCNRYGKLGLSGWEGSSEYVVHEMQEVVFTFKLGVLIGNRQKYVYTLRNGNLHRLR